MPNLFSDVPNIMMILFIQCRLRVWLINRIINGLRLSRLLPSMVLLVDLLHYGIPLVLHIQYIILMKLNQIK